MSDNAPAVMLSDLRRLLEGGLTRGGPAIGREPEDNRSVRGLTAVYLGNDIASMLGADPVVGEARWAVAPRRNHALLVALALYLGLDPGEGALEVSWFPIPASPPAPWKRWCVMADSLADFADLDNGYVGSIYAPSVAAEPDPIRALALAVAHVLAQG